MSYAEAVRALYELGHELHRTPAHKFDLAHMRTLLAALDEPHTKFPSVLIAGTNGKGSTAATLASIFEAAGHRTGLYTSPHLVRINERIRLNGHDIDDDDFAFCWAKVEAAAARLVGEGALPWHPSFFEMLTAMAFLFFARVAVNIAVLEVGLGGRLDATNVVEPIVSVITDISLDHEKFLGSTIAEIAAEKAGILRADGILVTLPQHPEANRVIGNRAVELGTRAVSAVTYVPPVSPNAGGLYGRERDSDHDLPFTTAATYAPVEPEGWRNRYPLDVMGERITVDSPLVGRHQLRNIALAIAAAEQVNAYGIPVPAQAIERGIRETRWSGRFQTLRVGTHELVLDVAHNPDGAWALRAALNERYPEADITIVFGAMRDKDIQTVASVLFPLAKRVVVTEARNPRAAAASDVASTAARWADEVHTSTDVPAALGRAFEIAPSNSLVVVTGSIYIVGEALQYLQQAAMRP